MNRRLALVIALACVACLQAGAIPASAQESPQTVTAAIPPQTPRATAPAAAPLPAARPAMAPPAASQPTPAAPAAPALAMPAPAAPVAMAQPVPPQPPTAPAAPQAKPAQTPVPPRPEIAPAPKPPSDYEAANVKIEVTISYQVGTGVPVKRMATLTVADQGRGQIRSGTQVAVPSTTFMPVAAGGPATTPMTSYNYKSVGLNVDANRVYIQGNKARLDLNVEFSAIDDKSSSATGNVPLFPTFSQSLTLVLESGKPVIVGQSSDVVDNAVRTQIVEVKATIIR